MLLLLLAVCGNTANLVLARASARHQRSGVRLAMGSGRGRSCAAMLTENLMLALLGAGLGIVIAFWATDAVMRAVPLISAFPSSSRRTSTSSASRSPWGSGSRAVCCSAAAGSCSSAPHDPLAAFRAGAPARRDAAGRATR